MDTLDGVVTLSGLVTSKIEIERTAEIAWSVTGVKGVTTSLTVGSLSAGQTQDDSVIGTKINSDLIAESYVRNLNIDVDAYNGVVTLTGIVFPLGLMNRIPEIPGNTEDVVKVIDNLKIATPKNNCQWQDLKLCPIHAQETVCIWLTICQIYKF